MVQDMNQKIETYIYLVLSYNMIKAWNIDSASFSVMTNQTFFNYAEKLSYLLLMWINRKISTFHRLKLFIRAL